MTKAQNRPKAWLYFIAQTKKSQQPDKLQPKVDTNKALEP